MIKISTKDIQELICKTEILKNNLPCENVSGLFYNNYEGDVFSLNKSGYVTEFEVKVSKSDFLSESKKVKKWNLFKGKVTKSIPNYFYYVCAEKLIMKSEVKDYQGLIYVNDKNELKIIKKAPLIHRYKHDREKIISKFVRIFAERLYLGCCRLTYENNKIKERRKLK
jgi:hypothetical protein